MTITSELVAPIKTAIDSGLGVLVPVGIGIMAAMIGISLIPRIIYKFLQCKNGGGLVVPLGDKPPLLL